MITDAELQLTEGLLLGTVITGTGLEDLSNATGGNIYDQGPLHADNIGVGHGLGGDSLYFWFRFGAANVAGGTINLMLVSDAVGAPLDGASVVHGQTGLMAIATMVDGYFGFIPLAPRGWVQGTGVASDWLQYVGVLANVGTADVTGNSTLDCGISRDYSLLTHYASGLEF